MTVRFYSSLDSGAPALSGSRFVDKLKSVLLGCLVNGYSSKPAAGWSVAHSHADGFTLSNGEGYINFANGNSGNSVSVYLLESLTGTATAIPTGDNRRSGPWEDGATETDRQWLYWSDHAAANPHWAVIADDKTVFISFGAAITSLDFNVSGRATSLYFGRYLNASGLPSFCALGGGNTGSANSLFTECMVGTMLRNPLTGLVSQGASPRYTPGVGVINALPDTTTRNNCVFDRFTPVRVAMMGYGSGISGAITVASSIYCGRLRGVVYDPYLAGLRATLAHGLLGAGTTWQDRVKLISLPGGGQFLPVYGVWVEPGVFVSMDPLDWE